MQILIRSVVCLACLITVSGCVPHQPVTNSEVNYQEEILLKAHNYSGLIELYRSWLKKKDDADVRFKLSRYYYLSGDYKSSLYFMQPLIANPDVDIYTLQTQNMIGLGDYEQAIRVTDKILQRDPENAEAFNLKGIALAQSGKLSEGLQAIEKSRSLFLPDDISVNNIAMIAIMDRRYHEAVSLLLPHYLRGSKHPQLLHNLVLSLVKVGDRRYARDIIQSENLSKQGDKLINALNMINPA